MIEHYPIGIPRESVSAQLLAACAAVPVLIWSRFNCAYRHADADEAGFTNDPDEAGRWTLAGAYIETQEDVDAVFQPIDYVKLDLPLPTSVNGLFVEAAGRKRGEGRQRVKTREYRSWIEAAGWALKPQLQAQGAPVMPDVPTFGKHWALWIRLNIDHASDVTNRIKAIEDLLVAWNITVGDQWNDRCLVERDRTIDVACRIIIYRKVQ